MRKAFLTGFALMLMPVASWAAGLTVFAAASLTNALTDIGVLWQAQHHPAPVFSFASSATLAQQIEHGAPAAIYASADEKWMDDAAARGAIVATTRIDLLGNSLVLIEKPPGRKVTIGRGFDLAALLGPGGRLAVADPASVPAGIYAEQALKSLGIWDSVVARLAPAEDVRAALRFVQSGDAPAGIVYATDARIGAVAVVGTFPADSHTPIRYPFAITRYGMMHASRESRAFLAFLQTPAARDVYAHYGFTAP